MVTHDDDLPPHDIEAERFCLASMMLDQTGKAISDVAEIVTGEHFFRPVHRVIFDAMIRMFAARVAIDPVTLWEWIKQDGDQKALGSAGPVVLAELMETAMVPDNAAYYAKPVFMAAVRRRMLEQAQRLESAAWGEADDVAEVIARADLAMAPLRNVIGGQRSADVRSFREFIGMESANSTPVIPGLLDHQDRVIVVATEGVGKTMLAHQVGFCAAAGVHPFEWSREIPPQRVLIMDLETPQGLLQRRLHAMGGRAGQYPGWDEDRVHVFHRPGGVNLGSAREAFMFAEVVRRVQPDLIVGGPVYKMLNASDPKAGLAAHAQVARFFDVMRERHGVAIWLEAHAPYAGSGDPREMRPEGSNIWAKWPEFGISMRKATKAHGGDKALEIGQFRGHRSENRMWPIRITRDTSPGGWPWAAVFPPGTYQKGSA